MWATQPIGAERDEESKDVQDPASAVKAFVRRIGRTRRTFTLAARREWRDAAYRAIRSRGKREDVAYPDGVSIHRIRSCTVHVHFAQSLQIEH